MCAEIIGLVLRCPGGCAGVLLRPGVSQLAGADVEEGGAGEGRPTALHRVVTELTWHRNKNICFY